MVLRHKLPHRSPVSIQFRGTITLSQHRNFLGQLDISSLLPQAPFSLTARFSWKSSLHKKQLRLWKHNLVEIQEKTTVYFGDMVPILLAISKSSAADAVKENKRKTYGEMLHTKVTSVPLRQHVLKRDLSSAYFWYRHPCWDIKSHSWVEIK